MRSNNDIFGSDSRFNFINLFINKDSNCNPGLNNSLSGSQIVFRKYNLFRYLFGPCVPGYESEFIVLPCLSNPRWIIRSDKLNVENLGFFVKPTSKISRLIWFFSLLFNKFGFFGFLYRSRLYTKKINFEEYLSRVFPDLNLAISAIYTGARSDEAKFIVQLNSDLNKRFFCKIGFTEKAKHEIIRELEILNRISNQFDVVVTPELINYNIFYYGDAVLFVMADTILENNTLSIELTKLDEKAFSEISFFGGVSSLVFLDFILELFENNSIPVSKSILEKYNSVNVHICYCHGDYIPWNRLPYGDKLILLDWERYAQYPVFYDHINFIIHVGALIKKIPEKDCLELILSQVSRLVSVLRKNGVFMNEAEINTSIISSLFCIYKNYIDNKNYKEDILPAYVMRVSSFLY